MHVVVGIICDYLYVWVYLLVFQSAVRHIVVSADDYVGSLALKIIQDAFCRFPKRSLVQQSEEFETESSEQGKPHISVSSERISQLGILDNKVFVLYHFLVVAFAHYPRFDQLYLRIFAQTVFYRLNRSYVTHSRFKICQQNLFCHLFSLNLSDMCRFVYVQIQEAVAF